MTSRILQRTLQELCSEAGWTYAIFWRLKKRPTGDSMSPPSESISQWALMWEDGYLMDPQRVAKAAMDATMGDFYGTQRLQVNFEMIKSAFSKLSYQIYGVGQGLIGHAVQSRNPDWVHGDQTTVFRSDINGSHLPQSGWANQFKAGVRTIAVIPVPGGAVQLGSIHHMARDTSLRENLHWRFDVLKKIPGVFLHDLFPPEGGNRSSIASSSTSIKRPPSGPSHRTMSPESCLTSSNNRHLPAVRQQLKRRLEDDSRGLDHLTGQQPGPALAPFAVSEEERRFSDLQFQRLASLQLAPAGTSRGSGGSLSQVTACESWPPNALAQAKSAMIPRPGPVSHHARSISAPSYLSQLCNPLKMWMGVPPEATCHLSGGPGPGRVAHKRSMSTSTSPQGLSKMFDAGNFPSSSSAHDALNVDSSLLLNALQDRVRQMMPHQQRVRPRPISVPPPPAHAATTSGDKDSRQTLQDGLLAELAARQKAQEETNAQRSVPGGRQMELVLLEQLKALEARLQQGGITDKELDVHLERFEAKARNLGLLEGTSEVPAVPTNQTPGFSGARTEMDLPEDLFLPPVTEPVPSTITLSDADMEAQSGTHGSVEENAELDKFMNDFDLGIILPSPGLPNEASSVFKEGVSGDDPGVAPNPEKQECGPGETLIGQIEELRKIVPGGQNSDLASLLQRTVEYISMRESGVSPLSELKRIKTSPSWEEGA